MSVQGYRIILFCYERIVGAAPAFVILTEDTFGHEVVDIVQRCVRGKFPDLGPLAGSEFTEEAVSLHFLQNCHFAGGAVEA